MYEENKNNCSEEDKENDIILMLFMFRGSYLTNKLGHEVINLFAADDGNYYIYVPPYGYVSDLDKIKTVLLARHIGNSKIEIFAKATVDQPFLEQNDSLRNNRNKENFEDIKERQRKYCDNILYGGKSLVEIFQFNNPNDRQHVLVSFKAKDFRFSNTDNNKRIDIFYNNSQDGNNSQEITEENCREMGGNLPRQTLKTYFSRKKEKKENNKNYTKLKRIIENDMLWSSNKKQDWSIKGNNATNNIETPYFIKVIGKEDDEIVFSNLIYYYFNKRDILNKFISEVLKRIDNRIKEVDCDYEIYREKMHIDILVEDTNQVIVIENKIKAKIHGNKNDGTSQLTSYYKEVNGMIKEEIENKQREKDPERFFFIFVPDYKKASIEKQLNNDIEKQYKLVSYGEIYKFFRKIIDEKYIDEFCVAMERHTKKSYPDDLFVENLNKFLKRIQG
ncbi:MAG: PD-(D/E)XK nuclease family protein [Lentisphaeria bacterium]|nr:PD-(D/E)XK nuclease family protein [Lentisphaeria bacterium]